MSKEIMQQALDAMEKYQVKSGDFDRFDDVIKNLRQALAQPEPIQVRPAEFAATVSAGVGADFVGTPMIWAEWPTRPETPMSPEHLPQYIATNNIKPTTEGGGGAGGAQPEQAVVSFPSFMRKRIEQAMEDAIHPKGMSVHDGKAKVLVSDLHRMLLVIDSAPTKRQWVGLTDDEINKIANSPQPIDETSNGYVLPFAHAIQSRLKEKNT